MTLDQRLCAAATSYLLGDAFSVQRPRQDTQLGFGHETGRQHPIQAGHVGGGSQRPLVGASSCNDTKPRRISIEAPRTVQVRHNAADPLDAICLELAALNSRAVAGDRPGEC